MHGLPCCCSLAPMSSAEAVVRTFIDRINEHDVGGLAGLMHEGFRFVDATGEVTAGRAAMRAAWATYFAWFPDYRIEIEMLVSAGNTVAVFGRASASYAGRAHGDDRAAWSIPAAWRALVQDGLVSEWGVYCDVEPMIRSMGKGRFGCGPGA